ncbi:hypothetical protein D3C86_1414270 [compost metagenome]
MLYSMISFVGQDVEQEMVMRNRKFHELLNLLFRECFEIFDQPWPLHDTVTLEPQVEDRSVGFVLIVLQ